MDRINELIDLIYAAQQALTAEEKIIEKAKENISSLEESIVNNKAELLSLIQDDKPIEKDDKVAIRMHRPNVGYTDESAVIKWLKENFNGKLVKTKITESLEKNPLKKELKTNQKLIEGLKPFIVNSVTDYVVVTNKDNYQKMLEEIKEGKEKC